MSLIPNALVSCYVIQLNNTQFIEGWSIIGRMLGVPCKNDFIDDPQYWAVPIKDEGILTFIEYIPVAASPNPPTVDSFEVFRVRDKLSGYTWWIYGSAANFDNSCATCCGGSPVAMPVPAGSQINIAPCSKICATNAAGNLESVFGLPQLIGGEVYFPIGVYNNQQLPASGGAGYATITLLLAFLNASWTNVGSPVAHFVWTASADGLTLIATGGFDGDYLCVGIMTIGPSA